MFDQFADMAFASYYGSLESVPAQLLVDLLPDSITCKSAFIHETLSEHGILPYHLQTTQNKLTNAFRARDVDAILRLSADIGHYISDAHVPLHTTENYNGQLTGQTGIHAFWESRLPELYSEEYDYVVGRAVYIPDTRSFFWQTVFDSHRLVARVLQQEAALSGDKAKYCYDLRVGMMVRTQCEAFARAYHDELDGMVERRLRKAIHAVGSCWYTAWVNAGRPVMTFATTPRVEKVDSLAGL